MYFKRDLISILSIILILHFIHMPRTFAQMGSLQSNYPKITQMEEKVFHRDFNGENIYLRLNRLETKVFGTISPNSSLLDRVDKLSSVIENTDSFDNTVTGTASPYQGSVFGTISNLELRIFGRSFDNDLITQRLDRLEAKIFGSNQQGSVDVRLNRIITATQNSFIPSSNGQITLMGNDYSNYQSSTAVKPGIKGLLQSLLMGLLNSYSGYGDPYGYSGSSYGYYDPYSPYNVQRNSFGQMNYGTGVRILP